MRGAERCGLQVVQLFQDKGAAAAGNRKKQGTVSGASEGTAGLYPDQVRDAGGQDMGMTYADCFAFEGGACRALYRMRCKGCGLYQTEAEMQERLQEDLVPRELWEYVEESRAEQDEI